MLFVGNLPLHVKDADLIQLFTDAGFHVVSGRIVRRRWGNPRPSKGIGFVNVGDGEAEARAVQVMHGTKVTGREIVVKIVENEAHDDDDEEHGDEHEAEHEGEGEGK